MVSISGLPTSGKVAASGAVLTVIGSVLPWASAVGETVLGVDGDGIITAPLAVIVLALAVLRWDKIGAGVSAVLGLAALLTAFNAYSNIESLGGFAGALVSVEYGLYLTLIGALVMVIGAGLAFTDVDDSEATAAAEA